MFPKQFSAHITIFINYLHDEADKYFGNKGLLYNVENSTPIGMHW